MIPYAPEGWFWASGYAGTAGNARGAADRRSRGAANLPGHECIRNEDTSTSA